MVVDLSRMRQVVVEPETRRGRISGGCLLGSVDIATQNAGLVFPSGVVSHTGAAGLILGGGTGWLTRRYGLSCDNVEGFTLVTVDGSLVQASASDNPDLFWALRGGGGNFGVVTEFAVKLHPLTSVTLGEGLCFGDNIPHVLRRWRDFMPQAPDNLKWNISLRLAPDTANVPMEIRKRPVASESLVWIGDPEEGKKYMDHALSICQPVAVRKRVVSFLSLQTMADGEFPHGRRYYTKSGYFTFLDDTTIDRMVDGAGTSLSSESQIELAYLGGAAGRVGAEETAFGDRSSPFIVNILGNWPDASEDAGNIEWVRSLFSVLRPSMKPGVYINFMSADEQERVPEAYQERWERLALIKSQYDPSNFFRLNQNILPHRMAGSSGRG